MNVVYLDDLLFLKKDGVLVLGIIKSVFYLIVGRCIGFLNVNDFKLRAGIRDTSHHQLSLKCVGVWQ